MPIISVGKLKMKGTLSFQHQSNKHEPLEADVSVGMAQPESRPEPVTSVGDLKRKMSSQSANNKYRLAKLIAPAH